MDNPSPLPTHTPNPRQARAELILDAAAELLRRFGYKRVTIDDVAARADIGKGTIYLHWKTREALFNDVLAREYAAALDELLAAIRKDARAALPHRLVSNFYRIVMRRPLLEAVYTADLETLGRLGKSGPGPLFEAEEKKTIGKYLALAGEYDLLPGGMSTEECLYAFFAVLAGFFLLDPLQPGRFDLNLESRARILEFSAQRLFVTPADLTVVAAQALAGRTAELFEQYAGLYKGQLKKAYE